MGSADAHERSGYRGDEIDRALAQSLLTFLGNGDEKLHFYGSYWSKKHEQCMVNFKAQLMLDIPFMRGSDTRNWRLTPIIPRGRDGTITRHKVTYVTPGYQFYD